MPNKLISLLLLHFVLLTQSFGAVAPDTSNTVFGNSVTSITISSYAVTGSNTLALCGSALGQGSTMGLSSVTFNGVAMTPIHRSNPFGTYEIAAWQMAGVSGTHDFVLSTDNAVHMGLGCATFTGVNQTTPIGTFQTSATPDPITTLTVPTNGLTWDFASDPSLPDCTDSRTPGGGQTLIFNPCHVFSGEGISLLSSYRTTTGDFSWPKFWIDIGVPINPVAAAGAVTRRRIINTP